jgi:hypothetical protein
MSQILYSETIKVEVSIIIKQQKVSNSLWGTWQSPFMTSRKVGIIMDQYDQRLEFPNNFSVNSQTLNFTKGCPLL